MNPILVILITVYLTVILTKNLVSNKEILEYNNPIIGNIIIFIRNNIDNIYLTIFTMLGIIIYFAMIGLDLNAKPIKTLEGEIVVEKFNNLGKNNLDNEIAKEKIKDAVIKNEYANAHHKVVNTLSSIERDKKCREKAEETCSIDPNCIWCIGPDKGCYGGSSAGINHVENNEKCSHFLYNGEEIKHVRDNFGATHKVN